MKGAVIRKSWWPDDKAPTADPCVRKMVVEPITHLESEVGGESAVMLKESIKGHILQ
jgi:hypothetical protein